MKKNTLFLLPIFLVFMAYNLHSQSDITMFITGKVINKNTGIGIPNVIVRITNLEDLSSFESISSDEGIYLIEKVPAGTYVLNS